MHDFLFNNARQQCISYLMSPKVTNAANSYCKYVDFFVQLMFDTVWAVLHCEPVCECFCIHF